MRETPHILFTAGLTLIFARRILRYLVLFISYY
jgi:hypothetical protein